MGRIRSLCRLFTPFYLSFFYQTFFLCIDALKQDGCRFIVWVLWYKFTMNGKV